MTVQPETSPEDVITPMMRVTRARRIAELRSQDPRPTWAKVAREVGLSIATCKRLLTQLEQTGDPDAGSSMRIVQKRIDALNVVMDEASATYAAAASGSAVRVGALKLFDQASSDMFDIAVRLGHVPRNLGAINAERRLQEIMRAFGDAARRWNLPDEFLIELEQLAEARLTPRPIDIIGHAIESSSAA